MAQSIPAFVELSVLRWVRESIELVPIAAARKIGVPDGRVAEWEAGTSAGMLGLGLASGRRTCTASTDVR
ncbi:MAG: hypothetical protein ACRDRI_22260 [Pseudonocardiaceae bacterium]